MNRNPLVFKEYFDQLLGGFNTDLSSDIPIGHRIIVTPHVNVVIQIDLGCFPTGKDEWELGQGFQFTLVNPLKQFPTRNAIGIHRPVIELVKQRAHRFIELSETGERLVT